MISIKAFETAWENSAIKKIPHPTGFHEGKFIAWWFTRFDDINDMYYIYVLYCLAKHNSKINDFLKLDLEKLHAIAVKAQIKINIANQVAKQEEE